MENCTEYVSMEYIYKLLCFQTISMPPGADRFPRSQATYNGTGGGQSSYDVREASEYREYHLLCKHPV
jgi:hypothetical protein